MTWESGDLSKCSWLDYALASNNIRSQIRDFHVIEDIVPSSDHSVEPLSYRFAWASRDFVFHIRYCRRHFESTQSLLHSDWSSVSNAEAVA